MKVGSWIHEWCAKMPQTRCQRQKGWGTNETNSIKEVALPLIKQLLNLIRIE